MNHESNGREPRIALLIDADNVPADKIDAITTELATLGVLNVRRAYGNWTKPGLRGWQQELQAYAIKPVQQFDNSKGKNATDMAMTVDAMELLYNERPDAFGIVSSDADFTPLVMHLRAKGAIVYGFGAKQTPDPFVNACSRFLFLEALTSAAPMPPRPAPIVRPAAAAADAPKPRGRAAGGAVKATGASSKAAPATAPVEPPAPNRGNSIRVPPEDLRRDAALVQLLGTAVRAARDESGWSRVGAMRQQIGNKTSFDPGNYGYGSLTKLLAAIDLYDMRDEGTSQVAVRKRTQLATPSA